MIPSKRTTLYDLHLQLGAKMVEFAGYQMPVQYKDGIIKEHLHCRSQAGFFDVSHMGQFWLTGDKVAMELERLTPSAISDLVNGQQQYTVLMNAAGGVIDDVIVSRFDDGFLMVVNAACKDKDLAHLEKHSGSEIRLEVLSDRALFALQGVEAVKVLQKFSGDIAQLQFMHSCKTTIHDIDCIISRCGYTGEDGFEISLPNGQALKLAELLLNDDKVKPIGLGARDTLRLEAGLCLYGHELDETVSPVAAGLSWTFRKDFSTVLGGDRLLADRKSGTAQKRVGLLVDGKQPVRADCKLFNQQNAAIGIVTSGGFSPTLQRPIAMAYINSEEITDNPCLYANVRNKNIPITLSRLPFVAHRHHKKPVRS